MGNKKLNVAVVGANGYGGIELVRILVKHPNVDIKLLVSRSEAGKKVSDVFPHLTGMSLDKDKEELIFTSPYDSRWDDIDLCFFATPHTVAMSQVSSLLKKGIKVIDLSADFRIKNQLIWEQWYGTRHTAPELIESAVYGLPELNRDEIKSAQLIACPGCYPTSVQMGLLPLITKDLLTTDTIIADVKSGTSGTGRSASLNMIFSERSENFEAYAVTGHRHYPEIKQQLELVLKREVDLIFTPHLVPMVRGIHSTIYAKLKEPEQDIQKIFEDYYAGEQFVNILANKKHPQTKSVTGTNHIQISVFRPPNSDYVTILVVEDNLIKGASGQAVQCMNIMYGIDESTGLDDLARI